MNLAVPKDWQVEQLLMLQEETGSYQTAELLHQPPTGPEPGHVLIMLGMQELVQPHHLPFLVVQVEHVVGQLLIFEHMEPSGQLGFGTEVAMAVPPVHVMELVVLSNTFNKRTTARR